MPVMELPSDDLEIISGVSKGIKVASLPHGSVIALVIAHNYGTTISVDLRVHADNVAGPLPLSEDLLEELGAVDPESTVDRLLDAKRELEESWRPVVLPEEKEVETPVLAE